MNQCLSLFLSCPHGLETLLAEEASRLGATHIKAAGSGIECSGNWEVVYRLNLHSRLAARVLVRIITGHFSDENALYALAKKVPWSQFFTPHQSFKVSIEGKKVPLASLHFASLKVKDALCDAFRDACGVRPNIDKRTPNIKVHVYLYENNAAIFLDTSGEALFKRGYRQHFGEAPIRENLAAGLLMLAGFEPELAFMDVFCGSGTIAIEAALIAKNQAPGLKRSFAFERLLNFNKALWLKMLDEAQRAIVPAKAAIVGSDSDAAIVDAAKKNAQHAGVADAVSWHVKALADTHKVANNGLLLSNPPYGVRLAEVAQLNALYPEIGRVLKQQFTGWRAAFISADSALVKGVRLKPARKIPVFNGKLDCRLYLFDVIEGSNR